MALWLQRSETAASMHHPSRLWPSRLLPCLWIAPVVPKAAGAREIPWWWCSLILLLYYKELSSIHYFILDSGVVSYPCHVVVWPNPGVYSGFFFTSTTLHIIVKSCLLRIYHCLLVTTWCSCLDSMHNIFLGINTQPVYTLSAYLPTFAQSLPNLEILLYFHYVFITAIAYVCKPRQDKYDRFPDPGQEIALVSSSRINIIHIS